MKKLFSLLFAAGLAVSLPMPVFEQDLSSASTPGADSGAKTQTKAKKAKKSKKAKQPAVVQAVLQSRHSSTWRSQSWPGVLQRWAWLRSPRSHLLGRI